MRIIKASEIGSYTFCQRAWWYQLNGYEPDNQAELAAGKEIHETHARTTRISTGISALASALLVAAVVLVLLWILKLRF